MRTDTITHDETETVVSSSARPDDRHQALDHDFTAVLQKSPKPGGGPTW